MHVKRVRFADADKVMNGLPHFSEHVSDDEFVPDKQPNDDPSALSKKLAESLTRLTRSHWLTCPRCTVPWIIPAARSLLTSSVKR
jgi:hypothetical protein